MLLLVSRTFFGTVMSMSFTRISVNPGPANAGTTPPPSPTGASNSNRSERVAQTLQANVNPGATRSSQTINPSPTAGAIARPVPKQTLSQGADMVSKKTLSIAVSSILVLGLVSGSALAWMLNTSGPVVVQQGSTTPTAGEESGVKVGSVFGVPDTASFKDDVEGVVVLGGLDGEGSHTLLRLGGESQNVYLTSSVVDLGQFENMKVRIWGETFKGQKAGWLMDVGRVEVLELNSELPNWYLQKQESSGGGE